MGLSVPHLAPPAAESSGHLPDEWAPPIVAAGEEASRGSRFHNGPGWSGKDLGYHHGIVDGGDERQGAATERF